VQSSDQQSFRRDAFKEQAALNRFDILREGVSITRNIFCTHCISLHSDFY